MTPGALATTLLRAGVQVSVAFEPDGEYLDLEPVPVPELVALVRQHKAELVEWLCGPNRVAPEVLVIRPTERLSYQEAGSPLLGSLAYRDWASGRPLRFSVEDCERPDDAEGVAP